MAGLIPISAEDDAAALAVAAPRGAVAPDDLPEAGAFTGAGTGAGMGVMRGGVKFVQGVNLAVGGSLARGADYVAGGGLSLDARGTFARAADRLAPVAGGPPRIDALTAEAAAAKPFTKWQDDVFGQLVKPLDDPIAYWTPDAHSVGAVGHILGGLAEIALPAMAGGSAGFIGTAEVGTAKDLVDKGVDPGTAVATGVATGAAFAAGMHVPILGTNLLTRMLSGAAGNVALFGSAAVSQHALLEDAGYSDAAKAFDVWDPQARALDVAMGVLFGGITHLGVRGQPAAVDARSTYGEAPRGTLAEQDAVLTAINANRQAASTPLRAATATGHDAHVQAFDAAMRAVVRGERVDVAALIDPADFHVDQPHPQLAAVETVARQAKTIANLTGNHKLVADAATAAGVDPHLALAIAQIESGVNPNAASPLSTARGIGQFLDSTWAAMGGTGANRFDAPTQARILAEFTARNTDDLRGVLKREPEPHEVYLGHLLGMGGARKVLTAPRDALMVDVMGPKVTNNNGMAGLTVEQAMVKWKGKLERAGAEPAAGRQEPIAAAPVRAYHGTKAEVAGDVAAVVPIVREVSAETAAVTEPVTVKPEDWWGTAPAEDRRAILRSTMGDSAYVTAEWSSIPEKVRDRLERQRTRDLEYTGPTMAEIEAIQDIPTVDRMQEAMSIVGRDEFARRAEEAIRTSRAITPDQQAAQIEAVGLNIMAMHRREAAATPSSPAVGETMAARQNAPAARGSPEPIRERQAPLPATGEPQRGTNTAPAETSAARAETTPQSGLKADYETARQTAEANPELVVHGDDGAPMLASDAIAAMDREIAEADFFSQAFEVAAACALRGGH